MVVKATTGLGFEVLGVWFPMFPEHKRGGGGGVRSSGDGRLAGGSGDEDISWAGLDPGWAAVKAGVDWL
jgi:hypothetical protein